MQQEKARNVWSRASKVRFTYQQGLKNMLLLFAMEIDNMKHHGKKD